MLKTRIISALTIAPFFFMAVVFSPSWLFSTFWSLIVLFAAREWAIFANLSLPQQWFFAAIVALISLFVLLIFPQVDPILITIVLVAVALTWLILVPLWLNSYAVDNELPLTDIVLLLIGAIMLVVFAVAAQLLWTYVGGVGLMGLLIITWSADIGAYFVGRYFGKKPLASKISPKKTIEGFIGGLIFALFIAGIFAWISSMPNYQWLFIAFSILVVSYATIGDLFESVLKRRRNLKDSSNLIPGHGGMMDRIDSWLPSMVLWATWFSLANLMA